MTVESDNGIMIYKLTEPFTRLLKTPVIKASFNTLNALGADGNSCVMWIEELDVSKSIE